MTTLIDNKLRNKYIDKRLLEVTNILDDIADTTGAVYVTISTDAVDSIMHFGGSLCNAITRMNGVTRQRFLRQLRWEDRVKAAQERAKIRKSKKGAKKNGN